jgi:hypothetical protein
VTLSVEAQHRLVLYAVEWVGLAIAFWTHHRMRPFRRGDLTNIAVIVVLMGLQIYGEAHRKGP